MILQGHSLARESYLPPLRRPNFGLSREGYGRYDFPVSGTKKEPKPKLLSPDIFWWGGGLPREGVGAKKFGMSLETQGIKHFWRDIPGFCRDILEAPEKFEKKMFGFNSRPLLCFAGFGYLPQTWRHRARFCFRAVVVDSSVFLDSE